MTENTCD